MTPIPRAQAIAEVTGPGQVHELVDAVIDGRRLRVFRNAPPSLRAMFEATASDLPFLVYEDERWTFAQAWRASARIGRVLVDSGVAKGDRVAIAMRNYPEWVLAFTAITSIGAVAVAVNAHWQADELAYGLADSGARVVVADQERLDRLAERPPIEGLQVLAVRARQLPQGARALAPLVEAVGDVDMPPAEIAPDDLVMMLYTSGSTGHPKGVPSTQRNVLSALLSWEADRLVGERVAGLPPAVPDEQPAAAGRAAVPCHRAACLVPASYRTAAHGVHVPLGRRSRRRADRARAPDPVVAPAAVTGDRARGAGEEARPGHAQMVGGGGAPRAPEQVRQIAASWQCHAQHRLGMTETNAIGTGISGADYLQRPASSGRCSLVLQIRVVDEQGRTPPAGQRSELLVRAPRCSAATGTCRRPTPAPSSMATGSAPATSPSSTTRASCSSSTASRT